MKISYLSVLLREANLSPEQLAKRLDVSHMTIRRWLKKSPNTVIPRIYCRTIENAVYELIADGILTTESVSVKEMIKISEVLPFKIISRYLGFSKNFLLSSKGVGEDRLIIGLSQIGSDEARREKVKRSFKKINKFKSLSKEWSSRIVSLFKAINSPKVPALIKFVAYGGLFYLICPLDFIPDYIPTIGYIDDFFILGIAANFSLHKSQ